MIQERYITNNFINSYSPQHVQLQTSSYTTVNLLEHTVHKSNIVKLFNFFIFFGHGTFQYVLNTNEIIMSNLQFIILLNIVKLLMRYMYMIWIAVMKVCLNTCTRTRCDLLTGHTQSDPCHTDSCPTTPASRCPSSPTSCCPTTPASGQSTSINPAEGWNQLYPKKTRY